jgi:hypothetical protein
MIIETLIEIYVFLAMNPITIAIIAGALILAYEYYKKHFR